MNKSGYENTQLLVVAFPTTLANLRTLPANTTGKLNILRHDSHTLGVNSTQVGIFEQTNKVGLSSFLEGKDSRSPVVLKRWRRG